jgi:hypothetical protein
MENSGGSKKKSLPRWYASAWWTVAVWNAIFQFNVLARTQQYGFALPLAPDFSKTLTPFAVASIGGVAGGLLLAGVSVGLWYHAFRVRIIGGNWVRRVPVISQGIEGRPLATLQVFVLLVSIAFPIAMQLHFVDKYLSGTSTHLGVLYANSPWGHLSVWPPHGCHSYVYDGLQQAAYCEFFEPWAVVLCAMLGILAAGYSVWTVFFGSRNRHL